MYFDNDEEIVKQNEEEKNKLIFDMALYGYEEYGTDFFNTKEYEKLLIEMIKNKTIQTNNFDLAPRTTKTIKEQANKLLISKLENVNMKVNYLPNDEKIIYDFIAQYGNLDENNKEEFIKFIKRKSRKREVTSIPTIWCTNDHRNGFYVSFGIQVDDIEFVRKLPNIASEIQLLNQNDDLGSTILIHEMTHALVDRHKGIIKNGVHNELLSIYMELLSAFELDETGQLFDIATLSRIQHLKNNMLSFYQNQYNGYIIDRQDDYIDSTLYAFCLLKTYIKASDKARKSITAEVNKTLSGERQLEETLERLNITEEEGTKIIKKKLKRLTK